MTLDESKTSDEKFLCHNLEFVIDKALLAQAQPINIDLDNGYLKIDCAIQFKKTAKQCGGCSCGGEKKEEE